MLAVPSYQVLEFLEWLHTCPQRQREALREFDSEHVEELAGVFLRTGGLPWPSGDPLRFLLTVFQVCPMIREATVLEQMEHFAGCGQCLYEMQVYRFERRLAREPGSLPFASIELHPLLQMFAAHAERSGFAQELRCCLRYSDLDDRPWFARPEATDMWFNRAVHEFGPRLLDEFKAFVAGAPECTVRHYEDVRQSRSARGEQPRPTVSEEEGTRPLSPDESPEQAASRLADSLRLLLTTDRYDKFLAANPHALHHLAVLGEVPENLGQALEFLEWVRRNYPDIRPDGDIPADELADLAYRFCEELDYSNARTFAGQVLKWLRGEKPAGAVGRFVGFIRRLWPSKGQAPDDKSPLIRYARVKLHGLFLFRWSDDFPTFIKEHWHDLHPLTAEELDIYYSNEDLRKRVAGFETRDAFRSLNVPDPEIPALVLWESSLAEAQTIPLDGLSRQDIVGVVQRVVHAIKQGAELDDVVKAGRAFADSRIGNRTAIAQYIGKQEINMGDTINFHNQGPAVAATRGAQIDGGIHQQVQQEMGDVTLGEADGQALAQIIRRLLDAPPEGVSAQEVSGAVKYLAAIKEAVEDGEKSAQVEALSRWKQWWGGLRETARNALGVIGDIASVNSLLLTLLGIPGPPGG
jgi:hypothetical protein